MKPILVIKDVEPGLSIVDKPINMTSTDVVNLFKKQRNEKKAGHGGT